jgi:hypothetical protein
VSGLVLREIHPKICADSVEWYQEYEELQQEESIESVGDMFERMGVSGGNVEEMLVMMFGSITLDSEEKAADEQEGDEMTE